MRNKKAHLKTIKKESSEDWGKIAARLMELKLHRVRGIPIEEHLNWLKNRRK